MLTQHEGLDVYRVHIEVIGKQGSMIKKIGTAAREELEKFFDRKVFLDLHVRVKSEWREDERVLGEIGLGGNE